jgi:hypothetical protein
MSVVHAWFTDRTPPPEMAQMLAETGVQVHVADED